MRIQLFQERLSYKSAKAYATTNGCLTEAKALHYDNYMKKGRAQERVFMLFLPETLLTSGNEHQLSLPIVLIGIVAFAFTTFVETAVWLLRRHSTSIPRKVKERKPGIKVAASLLFRKLCVALAPSRLECFLTFAKRIVIRRSALETTERSLVHQSFI